MSVLGGRRNPLPKPHRPRINRAVLNRELRRSAKQRTRAARRIPDAVKASVWARADGGCEAAEHFPDVPCWGRFEFHHRLRRSQGGQDTVENLLHTCVTHHARIHAFPQWSRDRGLLRGRYGRRVA